MIKVVVSKGMIALKNVSYREAPTTKHPFSHFIEMKSNEWKEVVPDDVLSNRIKEGKASSLTTH